MADKAQKSDLEDRLIDFAVRAINVVKALPDTRNELIAIFVKSIHAAERTTTG